MRPALPCGLIATVLLIGACTSSSHKAAPTPPTVQVSVTSCGMGWTPKATGQQHILLSDTDSRAGEVSLIDPRSGAIYAQVEPIGPGTTANMDVSLSAGSYALQCAMEDEAPVVGPTVTLTGPTPAGAAPGVMPVDEAQLVPATKQYEAYVSKALPGLVAEVKALGYDITSGDLAKAKADWLTAHLSYERLGAAYDAFGALDSAINGLDHGLPGGVADPGFSGFHRIEYGLWNGASRASLTAEVDALVADVGKLQGVFAAAQIDPLTISIRAHEISENALQFELTGEDDFGSHSELATVSANLDGTRTVLDMVSPLLASRTTTMPAIDAQLALTRQLVDAQHTPAGWATLASLTTGQREHIDSALSQLCELLAPVAAILEPRRTS